MSNAIEIRGLSWSPGREFSIEGLDLTVPQGSIYGFLGPNGSGKTFTIRLMMGMARPSRGPFGSLTYVSRSFTALEKEFGPDRFGQFWRSPQEPEVASREAIGQPIDQWVMEWIRSYLNPSPRGPGVPLQATFLAFLFLGIIAGGAVRMASRRGR